MNRFELARADSVADALARIAATSMPVSLRAVPICWT